MIAQLATLTRFVGGLSGFAGAILCAAVACGGDSTETPGSGGTDGSDAGAAGDDGSDGGGGGAAGNGGVSGQGGAVSEGGGTAGDAGTSGAGGSPSVCPTNPPEQGAECVPPWMPESGPGFGTTIHAHCSWGDDPRPDCRITARCMEGAWQVTTEAQECVALLPATCPDTPPESGNDCPDTDTACWYDDGTRCMCSACAGGPDGPVCQMVDPPQWSCREVAPNCPYPLPQAGTACDEPNQQCGLSCGYPVVCAGGVWQWQRCPECCPICASPDTPIATPFGERPIASLQVGDLVYSIDREAIVAVPLTRVGRTPVRAHTVVRIATESGAVLEMSPGHPTADGRSFGELTPGTALDDSHRVASAETVRYTHDATYDILPASGSGTYFAAGVLVGSTLFDRSGAVTNRTTHARSTEECSSSPSRHRSAPKEPDERRYY